MSKKSRFRGPFGNQHGKRAETLLKSASQHFDYIYRLLPRKLSWEMSLLLTCKILGLLVNTLADNEMYPVPNRENLTIQIQMHLPEKEKTFFKFFGKFFKSS